GYDFLHLYKNMDCSLQMGGSDQWGNITTGTELIRRIDQGKGYAITCPLITKSDGSKFGKSEGGNIWLDANRTSPYKFYQYWLNSSDEDAEKYIKIFTFLDEKTINALVDEHKEQPHLRGLQKRLAEEITQMVHSKEELENAEKASSILFSNDFKNEIKQLKENLFLDVFEGVTQAEVTKDKIEAGLDMIAALSAETNFLTSNGEARRALKENSVSVNKDKVNEDYTLTTEDLINDKYIVINRGKKNTYIIKVV
ncbi:MAG: tyrosine--tRNA ligase, partial [Olleya sp.]